MAWTVAGAVGLVLATGLNLLELLLWNGLDAVGIAPARPVFDVVQSAIYGAAISGAQYAVLRLVLDKRSSAARAWVPVSTLLQVGTVLVMILWLGGAPSGPTTGWFIVSGLGVLGQGLLLSEIFQSRSIIVLWLLAFGVISAVSYLAPLNAIFNEGVKFNLFVALIVINGILGAVDGAVTGAAVAVVLRRRVVQPASAV